jgi:hypothetical protein
MYSFPEKARPYWGGHTTLVLQLEKKPPRNVT